MTSAPGKLRISRRAGHFDRALYQLTEEKEIPLCFQDSIWGIGFRTKEDLGCVIFFNRHFIGCSNEPSHLLITSLKFRGETAGKRRTEIDYLRTRVCT